VWDASDEEISAIKSVGMSYVDTLRTHMEVEETDMFPLADGLLEIDDWQFVEAGIERLRAEGLDTLAASCQQKFGAQCAS
jgi:hemerythrin-like domain-containing protein